MYEQIVLVSHAASDRPDGLEPRFDYARPLSVKGVAQCLDAVAFSHWFADYVTPTAEAQQVVVSSNALRCLGTMALLHLFLSRPLIIPGLYPSRAFNRYFTGSEGRHGLRGAVLTRYLHAGAEATLDEEAESMAEAILGEVKDSSPAPTATRLIIHGHGVANRNMAYALAKRRRLDTSGLLEWETGYCQGIRVDLNKVSWLKDDGNV